LKRCWVTKSETAETIKGEITLKEFKFRPLREKLLLKLAAGRPEDSTSKGTE